MHPAHRTSGFTLIEILISLALVGLLMTAISGLVLQALGTERSTAERNELLRDARFAIDRMIANGESSRLLLLPLRDKPATNWPENIREQTIPASPPTGSSTLATAVFAFSLPASFDLDGDGFADADDDEDGLLDEDVGTDASQDSAAGIVLIDDDGDGSVDEGNVSSDDESTTNDDDPINSVDDDEDGNIDEDPGADMNNDGCPGVCNVDDNENLSIDEGSTDDDDEDGSSDEDPYDPVVYYLNGSDLIERIPVPWNEDGITSAAGPVDGRDYVESVLARNVTLFRVERLSDRVDTVAIRLELAGETGGTATLEATIRIGAAL